MDRTEWLNKLKTGDEVAVYSGLGAAKPFIAKIDRETRTRLVIGESQYRKVDGIRVGDGNTYYRSVIHELTPSLRKQIRRRYLIDFLSASNGPSLWNKLSDSQLEAIKRITEGHEG